MKYFYLLLLLVVSFGVNAQNSWNDFTGKEKAFLYHQARRIEILKPTLFHLFEFKDSIPYINDTLPDYRYVEKEIVNNPDLLDFHIDEAKRKSNGILNDLCVRYALWELDQILQYRNSTAIEDEPLKEKLKIFEQYVLEEAPQSASRVINSGEYVLLKTVSGYYSPSLTVADKMAAIVNSGYSQMDQMLILNAIMRAEEKYVLIRAREIFMLLGGQSVSVEDYLSAVGDGSNWAEVVGGFNTPYTIGLPDEKGLFRFRINEILDEEKQRKILQVNAIESKQLRTNANLATVVHIDVFGYHPERQTTVSIQKGGKAYVLYGKNEHRLVSPDSTYGEGTTYWRLMNNLEFYHIAHLKEDLYGKKGYEYQIDRMEQFIEKTKLRIKETEYKLDKLRHTPEGKPKIKKKKRKKKNLGLSDQAGTGHPTSALSKLDKKKNIEQSRLIQLNGQLEEQKRILKQLKEDMEKAFEKLIFCESKLDFMKKNIGYIIMEYEVDNHIYTFKDGAKFNYLTQDFIFPPNKNEEVFQLFHISFGKEVFDEKIDENFTHIHISNHNPKDKYVLKRIIRDSEKNRITESDSIQIQEIFGHLSSLESKAILKIEAGGIIGEEKGEFYRDTTFSPFPFDKENTSNNGLELYKVTLTADLNLTVTVYEDAMIPENFSLYQSSYQKAKSKYPNLNEIDFYTAIRAKAAAEKWVQLLTTLANQWIKDPTDKRKVLSKLNKIKIKKVYFPSEDAFIKVPAIAS